MQIKTSITFAILALSLSTVFLIVGCGMSKKAQSENWYSSVTWSPDGSQVAYFRRQIAYDYFSPRLSWFIAEETRYFIIQEDELFLCINSLFGNDESILATVKIPIPQSRQYQISDIYTVLRWEGHKIYYAAKQGNEFSTGIHRFDLLSQIDEVVDHGEEALRALVGQEGRKIFNGLELYSGAEGNYGYFNKQTILLFDHNTRNVTVFLHDPLSRKKPYIPTYQVTGK